MYTRGAESIHHYAVLTTRWEYLGTSVNTGLCEVDTMSAYLLSRLQSTSSGARMAVNRVQKAIDDVDVLFHCATVQAGMLFSYLDPLSGCHLMQLRANSG